MLHIFGAWSCMLFFSLSDVFFTSPPIPLAPCTRASVSDAFCLAQATRYYKKALHLARQLEESCPIFGSIKIKMGHDGYSIGYDGYSMSCVGLAKEVQALYRINKRAEKEGSDNYNFILGEPIEHVSARQYLRFLSEAYLSEAYRMQFEQEEEEEEEEEEEQNLQKGTDDFHAWNLDTAGKIVDVFAEQVSGQSGPTITYRPWVKHGPHYDKTIKQYVAMFAGRSERELKEAEQYYATKTHSCLSQAALKHVLYSWKIVLGSVGFIREDGTTDWKWGNGLDKPDFWF